MIANYLELTRPSPEWCDLTWPLGSYSKTATLSKTGQRLLDSIGLLQSTVEHFGLTLYVPDYHYVQVAEPLLQVELRDMLGRIVGNGIWPLSNRNVEAHRERLYCLDAHDAQVNICALTSNALYNTYALGTGRLKSIVVVQGLFEVWYAWQRGLGNVIGCLGEPCQNQLAALVKLHVDTEGTVHVVTNESAVGRRFAERLLPTLSALRRVRWHGLLGNASRGYLAAEHGALPFITS